MSFQTDLSLGSWLVRCLGTLGCLVGMTGCALGPNPDYDPPAGATAETTTATGTDTAGSAGPSTSADAGTDSGSETSSEEVVEVVAVIAECVGLPDDEEGFVNPDACEASTSQGNNNAGQGEMLVDLTDADLDGREVRSFLKFPWDPAYLAQGASVELVLHTTAGGDGDSSDQTGEVWLVESFDLESLNQSTPSTQGSEPKATDLGMAANNAQVRWQLPVSLFTEGQPVYLGVLAVSGDGVNYWNLEAKFDNQRPMLVVTFN